MEKDLISIIVPVYNVEKYLEKCIQSVLEQTYKKFEVIFINDGSTDNSLDILKKYQEIDDRVIIINKINAGTGAARNDGLNIAKGEFISFLDSDDWYEQDYLEKLYKNLKINNSDVAMCNLKIIYENEKKIENLNTYYFQKINLKKEPKKILRILEMPVLWNKLYKIELIKKYEIKFPSLSKGEDVVFLYKFFSNVSTISKTEEILYNYIKRDNSATTNEKNILWIYLILEEIEKYVKNYSEIGIKIFQCYKLQYIYSVSIPRLKNNLVSKKEKLEICKNNKKILKNIKKSLFMYNKKVIYHYFMVKIYTFLILVK